MENLKKWRVVGVDQESGLETSLVLEASSSQVAALMAKRKGIDVADIVDIAKEQVDIIRKEMEHSIPNEEPPQSRRPLRQGEIICPNPNCGYRGTPRRVARGSSIVAIVLLLFFLLPGLIYVMFKGGYRYYCPRCGTQIGIDV